MTVTINGSTGISSPGGDTSTSLSTGLLTVTGSTVPANGMYLPSANTLSWATNSTRNMTLDSSGRLGIGVSGPTVGLDLRGTSATTASTIQIVGNSVSSLLLGQNADGGVVRGQGGNNALTFWTGGSGDTAAGGSGTERARIDSSGNLLVGTTSGSYRVTISGTIGVSGTGGNGIAISSDNSSNIFIPRAYTFGTAGGVAVYCQSDGRLGPNASSKKYKTEIQPINDISWLYKLNPVSFYYKNDTSKSSGTLQYGLIAEEVDEINTELVHKLNGEIESVHYHKLYAPMLKAIQELTQRLEALEAK